MQIGVSLGLSQPWVSAPSGSAGTFTLASLSPLGLYDRQTSTVVDDGAGLLNSIANDGSAGGTFSQSTVSDKPDNLTSGFPPDTTKPSIRFKGTDDGLSIPISAAPASVTAAMVLYPTSMSDIGFGVAGYVLGATANGGLHMQITSAGAVEWVRPSVSAMGGTGTGVIVNANPHIIVATYVQATGAYTFRVNGNATASGTSVQTLTASTLSVGRSRGTGSLAARAHIPALFWNTKVETLADQQKIEGRLAWDWNIKSVLPGDHPYKTNGPN